MARRKTAHLDKDVNFVRPDEIDKISVIHPIGQPDHVECCRDISGERDGRVAKYLELRAVMRGNRASHGEADRVAIHERAMIANPDLTCPSEAAKLMSVGIRNFF